MEEGGSRDVLFGIAEEEEEDKQEGVEEDAVADDEAEDTQAVLEP